MTPKEAREGLSKAARKRIKSGAVPRIHLRKYRKAMLGSSRTAAVFAFCLECCGWSMPEVDRCQGVACPLYLYRRPRTMLVALEDGLPKSLIGKVRVVDKTFKRRKRRKHGKRRTQ